MKRWLAIFAALAIAGLADAVLRGAPEHGEFWWSHLYGFFAFFGLSGCLAIILVGKYVLGPPLQREEDYYSKGRSA
jgi:hypothetical protein